MAVLRHALLACAASILVGCENAAPTRQAARPLDNGTPTYPRDEEMHGREGTAVVDCALTETGSTRNCIVLAATAPDFATSALTFASHARYAPELQNGHPTAVLHHTYKINYTTPPRTFTLSALCDVQASGAVRNCRPAAGTGPTSWPTLKTALERTVASPHMVAGQAVDQADRPVSLMVAVGRLPLTKPLPEIPGDSFLSLSVTCSPASNNAVTHSRCIEAKDTGVPTEHDGMTHLRVRVGIIGLVVPDMGDFSQ